MLEIPNIPPPNAYSHISPLIVTFLKNVALWNTVVVIELEIVVLATTQLVNASLAMLVILPGMVKLVNAVHPLNVALLITVTPLGIVTLVKLIQLLNA